MRLTLKELEALGSACGFALAGDALETFDDEKVVAAMERAHEKVTRMIYARRATAAKRKRPDPLEPLWRDQRVCEMCGCAKCLCPRPDPPVKDR